MFLYTKTMVLLPKIDLKTQETEIEREAQKQFEQVCVFIPSIHCRNLESDVLLDALGQEIENSLAIIEAGSEFGHLQGNRRQKRRHVEEDEGADETTGNDVEHVMAPDDDARDDDGSGPSDDAGMAS